jgi:2-phospho-L-lactate guanylyltransferase
MNRRDDANDASTRRVSVIVPVKRLGAAKSRTQLPSPERERLALDLMTRTVTAALAATSVARVIVVAGDDEIATQALSLGAQVLMEPDGAGLNGAIDAGRDLARHEDDDIAIVVGDLADLRPADLDAVITEFGRTGSAIVVPDHLGTGTAMLVHSRAETPPLLFGPDSAQRHQAAGYAAFADAPASARRDVDSPEDVETRTRPRPD